MIFDGEREREREREKERERMSEFLFKRKTISR